MRPKLRRALARGTVVAGIAGAATVTGTALAQQADRLPGADFFLDFRAGLTGTDNPERVADPDGGEVRANTDLTLGYDSETRAQSFSARLFGRVQTEQEDGRAGLTDRSLRLSYDRTAANAALGVDLRYEEQEIGFEFLELDFEENVLTGADLVVDTGIRRTLSYGLDLALGQEGPVGLTLGIDGRQRRYDDADNADFVEEDRFSADARARLALTRTADLIFLGSYSLRDADDEAETYAVTGSFGAGLDVDITPALSFEASASHSISEVTKTENGDRDTRRREAPTFRLGLTQQRPNGTISIDAVRSLASTGPRTRVTVGRAVDLKSGELSGRAGVTVTEDSWATTGQVSYTHQMRNGDLRVALARSVRTNDDETDIASTRADVSYRTQIDRLSFLSLDMRVSADDALEDDAEDRSRASLGVTYSRALTEDWSLQAGFRHSRAGSSDAETIAENRIFANIGRRFDLRP